MLQSADAIGSVWQLLDDRAQRCKKGHAMYCLVNRHNLNVICWVTTASRAHLSKQV